MLVGNKTVQCVPGKMFFVFNAIREHWEISEELLLNIQPGREGLSVVSGYKTLSLLQQRSPSSQTGKQDDRLLSIKDGSMGPGLLHCCQSFLGEGAS